MSEHLVDLSEVKGFVPNILAGKELVVVPSQGEHDTKILVGDEGEMRYEHRQEAAAIGSGNVFVARCPLPVAEAAYRAQLFGNQRPLWVMPPAVHGEPLDKLVLADRATLQVIAGFMGRATVLHGFNQTLEMQAIADTLGIPYYGNPEFAAWAGGKLGLAEFAAECGVYTPHTFALHYGAELRQIATQLRSIGYDKLVVKVNHSTGGMGHKVSSIDAILADDLPPEAYLPDEFTSHEGAAVQGWIDGAKSMSIAAFIEHDGSAVFTGAQVHKINKSESAFGAIGAEPIGEDDLAALVAVGRRLVPGYIAHRAYGPHTMGMILPPADVAQKLGFPAGVSLCNDENTRPGASTISKEWILALRNGKYGIGWLVSKIKVPVGTKIADALAALDDRGLLLKKTGSDAHGIFVFNGGVLDYGEEHAFYAIAISASDDPEEARHLMGQAWVTFNGGK